MGSKAGLVFLGDGLPKDTLKAAFEPDLARSAALASVIAGAPVEHAGVRTLDDQGVWPEPGVMCVGACEGFALVGYREIGPDRPSEIGAWIDAVSPTGSAHGVFMHSVVDFGAFAVWEHGVLRRSVSLTPDAGIVENIGDAYAFESPFWDGERPLDDAPGYPLPFHPLDFADEALLAFFGFGLERPSSTFTVDPGTIGLPAFRIGP